MQTLVRALETSISLLEADIAEKLDEIDDMVRMLSEMGVVYDRK